MHALHWWRDFNMRHVPHFYIWKLRINNVILSQYRYQDSRRLVLFAALNWFMGPSTNNVCNFLGIFTLLSPILAVFFSAKGFFMSLISSKKRTKEFDFTTMIPQVDLFLFVFWRKSLTPKNHFEIIWPLRVCNLDQVLTFPPLLNCRRRLWFMAVWAEQQTQFTPLLSRPDQSERNWMYQS